MLAVPLLDMRVSADLLGDLESYPDKRLYDRVPKVIEHLVCKLLPPTGKPRRDLQIGARRFVRNKRLCGTTMLDSLCDANTAALPREQEQVLLIAHDTSEIDKAGSDCPDDAGPLRSPHSRGYLLHYSIGLSPDGRVFGALDAQAWTRSWQLRNKDHHSRPLNEKETRRWGEGVVRVERRLREAGVCATVIHIGDDEMCFYELFEPLVAAGRHFIVREKGVRNVVVGETTMPLEQACTLLPELGRYEQDVDSRVKERARGARHVVRTATMRLCARRIFVPAASKASGARSEGVTLWLVLAEEVDAPVHVEPLRWVLLTTLPAGTFEQARRVVSYYERRWAIEDFNKVLKSGLGMERENVGSIADFKRQAAVMMAAATSIVSWTTRARTEGEQPAAKFVDATLLTEMRQACAFDRVWWPTKAPSLHQMLEALAGLGGYERRPDRHPGWLVLLRGWLRLQDLRRAAAFFSAGNLSPPRSVPT